MKKITAFPPKNRRSIRLKSYDYSLSGYYFVTICVQDRRCLLGDIKNSKMIPNETGRMVQKIWDELPKYYTRVAIDSFVLMPNHLHGIIALNVWATFMAPEQKGVTQKPGVINHAPTLGEIIRRFKAVSTRVIRQKGWNSFSWQRNYYEHVIRKDESLDKMRQYINETPIKWELDEENPNNINTKE